MPNETKQAIEWALNQYIEDDGYRIFVKANGIINKQLLVDFVRYYFNENNIEYDSFSYTDLELYLD